MQQEVNFTLDELEKSATLNQTSQSHHRETTVSSCETLNEQPSDDLKNFLQMRTMLNLMLDSVKTVEDVNQVRVTLTKVFMESLTP